MTGTSYDYHTHFHNTLGHITTARAAISVLIEDLDKLDRPTVNEMLTTSDKHLQALITEINDLRKNVYKDLNI